MNPNVVLPFLSSVLSFAFAVMVGDQWLRRRQPYQLVWTIGLLWYGISAGTEFLGSAFGWSEALYRAWYLIGAFGVASYLGLGTVFLLNRTRFGYFVAFSLFGGGLFSILAALARAKEGVPASGGAVAAVVAFSTVGAVALAVATRFDRRLVAPLAVSHRSHRRYAPDRARAEPRGGRGWRGDVAKDLDGVPPAVRPPA